MPIDMKDLARMGARTRLAELVAEMDALLEAFPDLGKEQARPGASHSTRRRKLSEETKAKMREAWAKRKSTAASGNAMQPETTTKKKRVMSAEARARIAAAQKKRWAAIRKTSKR
jgi:monoamine oxidase